MSLGDAAYMQIKWIEMVYNVTKDNEDKRSLDREMLERNVGRRGSLLRREESDERCKVVCSIDDVDKVGESKVLWKSSAPHMLDAGRWTIVAVVVMAVMAFW